MTVGRLIRTSGTRAVHRHAHQCVHEPALGRPRAVALSPPIAAWMLAQGCAGARCSCAGGAGCPSRRPGGGTHSTVQIYPHGSPEPDGRRCAAVSCRTGGAVAYAAPLLRMDRLRRADGAPRGQGESLRAAQAGLPDRGASPHLLCASSQRQRPLWTRMNRRPARSERAEREFESR